MPFELPTLRAPEELSKEELIALLAQQQRLAQAGYATAGLIHDVKNHVMIVLGTSDLGLHATDPAAMRVALERVKDQCQELADLVAAFLGFVQRAPDASGESFDAGDALDQAAYLLRPLAKGANVRLETRLATVASLHGYRYHLVESIVNLAANAVQAMRAQGGTLQLHLEPLPGGGCCVVVADNGPGISAPMRARLFKPFTTTRSEDGGTGLGMWLVRQSVRALGGTVSVETSSAGTTFRLAFPVATPEVRHSETAKPLLPGKDLTALGGASSDRGDGT